jgi:hypothetical protein
VPNMCPLVRMSIRLSAAFGVQSFFWSGGRKLLLGRNVNYNETMYRVQVWPFSGQVILYQYQNFVSALYLLNRWKKWKNFLAEILLILRCAQHKFVILKIKVGPAKILLSPAISTPFFIFLRSMNVEIYWNMNFDPEH